MTLFAIFNWNRFRLRLIPFRRIRLIVNRARGRNDDAGYIDGGRDAHSGARRRGAGGRSRRTRSRPARRVAPEARGRAPDTSRDGSARSRGARIVAVIGGRVIRDAVERCTRHGRARELWWLDTTGRPCRRACTASPSTAARFLERARREGLPLVDLDAHRAARRRVRPSRRPSNVRRAARAPHRRSRAARRTARRCARASPSSSDGSSSDPPPRLTHSVAAVRP